MNHDEQRVRHGWVVARADGIRAKCGGPAQCEACRDELEEIGQREPMRPGATGTGWPE